LVVVSRRCFYTTTTTTTTSKNYSSFYSILHQYNRRQIYQQQRLFSQKVVVNLEEQQKQQTEKAQRSNIRWIRFARVVRMIRIPVLVVSVYSFGYQQGIIDCTKAPGMIHDQIFVSILKSSGVTNFQTDVTVIHENELSHFRAYIQPQYKIAAVGHRIVDSARNLVNDEFQKAIATVQSTLPSDLPAAEITALINKNETVQYWYNARLRVEGEDVNRRPWKYIILKSTEPNAFVTEVLPQHFFITTAMLEELATTPDQLAFVLGHEVAHLVLGHVSASNQVETALRTLEILLLSMDPTAGVISLGFITLLYYIRSMISASYSRENEYEADELGLIITARACFDTISGVDVMYKLYEHGIGIHKNDPIPANANKETGWGIFRRKPPLSTVDNELVAESKKHEEQIVLQPSNSSVFDSHPPTLERYIRLKQMALPDGGNENYTKYKNQQCSNITSRFFNTLLYGGNTSSTTNTTSSSKNTTNSKNN
jgi:Zn-dependent protease with chaperone function